MYIPGPKAVVASVLVFGLLGAKTVDSHPMSVCTSTGGEGSSPGQARFIMTTVSVVVRASASLRPRSHHTRRERSIMEHRQTLSVRFGSKIINLNEISTF